MPSPHILFSSRIHEVRCAGEVSGEEKKKLQVSDLLAKFQIASGGEFANDRMILS